MKLDKLVSNPIIPPATVDTDFDIVATVCVCPNQVAILEKVVKSRNVEKLNCLNFGKVQNKFGPIKSRLAPKSVTNREFVIR